MRSASEAPRYLGSLALSERDYTASANRLRELIDSLSLGDGDLGNQQHIDISRLMALRRQLMGTKTIAEAILEEVNASLSAKGVVIGDGETIAPFPDPFGKD